MDERIIYDGFERVWRLFEKTEREIAELRLSQQETERLIQRISLESEQRSKDLEKRFQETDQRFQETDRRFQDLEKRFQETTEQIRETDKHLKETDRQLKETDRQLKETDRQLKETDRQLKETDKQVQRVSRDIGRLGGRWGEFVESMVKPAVVRLFQQRGLNVHGVHHNVLSKRNGIAAEIDLLVTNDQYCVAVEVKSFLSVDDVREHLERLEKFKYLFPRYQDAILYGAVAGAVIPEDVAKYAYRQGFFVLGQKGENMEILNDTSFEPKPY